MQTIIGKNIDKAIRLLEEGKIIAIPTETVYGLAANALNEEAVIKIFEAKNRPAFNPLIVHIKSWDDAGLYAQHIPAIAHQLAKALSPGPITFLLSKKDIIPDLVTAGSALVAIRVPNHPLTLSLLSRLAFPLAAPSANEFGYISPTLASHVLDSLEGKIEYILDGEAASVGLESTIIGFDENEQVIVHRVGGVSIEEIEEITGFPVKMAGKTEENKPTSSGQLKSHYAPKTELYIGDIAELAKKFEGKKMVSINFQQTYELNNVQQFVLSETASLSEASKNLFHTMRQIDKLDADIILAEIFPDNGLGKAINDRLSRAQAIYK